MVALWLFKISHPEKMIILCTRYIMSAQEIIQTLKQWLPTLHLNICPYSLVQ